MKFFPAFLASLLVSSVANAEVTAKFVKDEFYFGAGNNTWALEVTSDTDWLSGEIDIQLSSGYLPSTIGFPPGRRPTFDSLNDCGVFGKDFVNPTIAPDWVNNRTQFTAAWETAYADEVGTFYIGAFTFSPDANGAISGRVTAVNPSDPINPLVFELEGWSVVDGDVIQNTEVPEPSAIVVMGLSMAGLVLAYHSKR